MKRFWNMLSSKNHYSQGLSVIAIFYNMRREAERTLHSLTRAYQGLDADYNYEVLVIDNGSKQPLIPSKVNSYGAEFSYYYEDTDNPSPCETINKFAQKVNFENLMIIIDGARILSPGIIRLTARALEIFPHPFVYTFGMHVGPKAQNYLVGKDYDQLIEDGLLETIEWERNGYLLFQISSPGLSSKQGFYSRLTESNCFALKKSDFLNVGMFQTQFRSPGGGLCNLDFFNRMNEAKWIQPIMLLGEATFHQFHGGVATNVSMDQHPWGAMEREYLGIYGKSFEPVYRPPLYLGSFREECSKLYTGAAKNRA